MTSISSSPIRPLQPNTRALLVFTIYLATNTLLTFLLSRSIVNAYSHLSQRVRSRFPIPLLTFTALALTSLGVTWHYMLHFFVLSYRSWKVTTPADRPTLTNQVISGRLPTVAWIICEIKLGPWLKDVQLFREAWETVVETPARMCWSMPIFFVTVSWSFWIAKEAQRRSIKYAWAYMLLGQLAAISFAMNLFYLAVLVHPDHDEIAGGESNTSKGSKEDVKQDMVRSLWTPPWALYSAISLSTFLSIFMATTSAGQQWFLLYLALPHVLLLLPPVLHHVLPRQYGTVHTTDSTYNIFYAYFFRVVCCAGVLFESVALYNALYTHLSEDRHLHRHSNVYDYPWQDEVVATRETPLQALWRSLLDHPAVSSVGWNSVLCAASFLAWRLVAR